MPDKGEVSLPALRSHRPSFPEAPQVPHHAGECLRNTQHQLNYFLLIELWLYLG